MKLFIILLNVFSLVYYVLYQFSDLFADVLKIFVVHYHVHKLEDIYWKLVKFYRFLRPVRKLMWFIYAITGILSGPDASFYIIVTSCIKMIMGMIHERRSFHV